MTIAHPNELPSAPRVLIAGWFSFIGMGATAGDLMARDLTATWLASAGMAYDIANAPPFTGGVDWRGVDPSHYSHLVFVCGPFGDAAPATDLLAHFAGRRLIGLDLTMLQATAEYNPFDVLLERDSDVIARPDMAFGDRRERVPTVGVILVKPQNEYKAGGRYAQVNAAVHRLLEHRPCARFPLDTCLEPWNFNGHRTPAEIEAAIAAMDVVVTTRLHGMVLALKNGVPAVVIDPVAGGAKIMRQAKVVGWPAAVPADQASEDVLARWYDWSLGEEAQATARRCAATAQASVDELREAFLNSL